MRAAGGRAPRSPRCAPLASSPGHRLSEPSQHHVSPPGPHAAAQSPTAKRTHWSPAEGSLRRDSGPVAEQVRAAPPCVPRGRRRWMACPPCWELHSQCPARRRCSVHTCWTDTSHSPRCFVFRCRVALRPLVLSAWTELAPRCLAAPGRSVVGTQLNLSSIPSWWARRALGLFPQ